MDSPWYYIFLIVFIVLMAGDEYAKNSNKDKTKLAEICAVLKERKIELEQCK